MLLLKLISIFPPRNKISSSLQIVHECKRNLLLLCRISFGRSRRVPGPGVNPPIKLSKSDIRKEYQRDKKLNLYLNQFCIEGKDIDCGFVPEAFKALVCVEHETQNK
jgi:hypothetical protein